MYLLIDHASRASIKFPKDAPLNAYKRGIFFSWILVHGDQASFVVPEVGGSFFKCLRCRCVASPVCDASLPTLRRYLAW